MSREVWSASVSTRFNAGRAAPVRPGPSHSRAGPVPLDSDALEAVQALALGHDPYLVLVDSDGAPQRVLQGTEFIRFILPEFVVVQPGLVSLFGFDGRERLTGALAGKRTR